MIQTEVNFHRKDHRVKELDTTRNRFNFQALGSIKFAQFSLNQCEQIRRFIAIWATLWSTRYIKEGIPFKHMLLLNASYNYVGFIIL